MWWCAYTLPPYEKEKVMERETGRKKDIGKGVRSTGASKPSVK